MRFRRRRPIRARRGRGRFRSRRRSSFRARRSRRSSGSRLLRIGYRM